MKVTNYEDTLMMHYLLNENEEHGLKYLTNRYLGIAGYDREYQLAIEEAKKKKHPKPHSAVPLEILAPYCGSDADFTLRCYNLFQPKLEEEPKLNNLYRGLILPMSPIIGGMEMEGMIVDMDVLDQFDQVLSSEIEKIRKTLPADMNLNSSQQLGDWLFNKLKLPVLSRTDKTGAPSTGKEVLRTTVKNLRSEGKEDKAAPILRLLYYRKLTKAKSVYIDGMRERIGSDGRVHCEYKMHGTVTGRLSSSDPNLLNIPKALRSIFVAPLGYVFIEADYGQMEVRMWAVYSKDSALIEAVCSEDVHRAMASRIYGIPEERVTSLQRQTGKNTTFAVQYLGGEYKVAELAGLPLDQARDLINGFRLRFPLGMKWISDTIAFARKHGYVENLFGRKRRLPEINSKDQGIRTHAERQAVNSPIQSVASDVTFIGMVRADRWMESHFVGAVTLLNQYDSNLWQISDKDADNCEANLGTILTKEIPGVDVPLAIDLMRSKHWGGEPDPPALIKELREKVME